MVKGLRRPDILTLLKICTVTYGLNSFSYLAAKPWSTLPNQYRTGKYFNNFRKLTSPVILDTFICFVLIFLSLFLISNIR